MRTLIESRPVGLVGLTDNDYEGEAEMGGAADGGADEHFGWQVEYLNGKSNPSGATARTDHPSARHYELVSDRNENTPTLVLSDEDDETIALYNGLSWIAARRIAKPGESK